MSLLKIIALLMAFGALSALSIALAQDEIALGDTILGRIDAQTPAQIYDITLDAPAALTITGLSGDFAPTVIVYGEDDRQIARANSLAGTPTAEVLLQPPTETSYRVIITGTYGTTGDFQLSSSATTDPVAQRELLPGQIFSQRVNADGPRLRYVVNSVPDAALALQFDHLGPSGVGAGLQITDADGRPLGINAPQLDGSRFLLPAAQDQQYILDITHSGSALSEEFQLSLMLVDANTDANAPPASSPPSNENTIVIADTAACSVTTASADGVNVRQGPGTNFQIIGGIGADDIITVTGRNLDNSWWQVEFQSGRFGWVADVAVQRGGDCSAIGRADFEFLPTPESPSQLTATPTPEPTSVGGS